MVILINKLGLVGCGTLFIERKFVHQNGLVGHLEDVVTDHCKYISKKVDYRGRHLGKLIIETLKEIGRSKGCYKVILDCVEKNVPFYEKCGFVQSEVRMASYFSENDEKSSKL